MLEEVCEEEDPSITDGEGNRAEVKVEEYYLRCFLKQGSTTQAQDNRNTYFNNTHGHRR